MNLSRTHTRCLIEATIGDLVSFRRGFARSAAGPFFGVGTINALVRQGILRAYWPARGKRGIRISGRAA